MAAVGGGGGAEGEGGRSELASVERRATRTGDQPAWIGPPARPARRRLTTTATKCPVQRLIHTLRSAAGAPGRKQTWVVLPTPLLYSTLLDLTLLYLPYLLSSTLLYRLPTD